MIRIHCDICNNVIPEPKVEPRGQLMDRNMKAHLLIAMRSAPSRIDEDFQYNKIFHICADCENNKYLKLLNDDILSYEHAKETALTLAREKALRVFEKITKPRKSDMYRRVIALRSEMRKGQNA